MSNATSYTLNYHQLVTKLGAEVIEVAQAVLEHDAHTPQRDSLQVRRAGTLLQRLKRQPQFSCVHGVIFTAPSEPAHLLYRDEKGMAVAVQQRKHSLNIVTRRFENYFWKELAEDGWCEADLAYLRIARVHSQLLKKLPADHPLQARAEELAKEQTRLKKKLADAAEARKSPRQKRKEAKAEQQQEAATPVRAAAE